MWLRANGRDESKGYRLFNEVYFSGLVGHKSLHSGGNQVLHCSFSEVSLEAIVASTDDFKPSILNIIQDDVRKVINVFIDSVGSIKIFCFDDSLTNMQKSFLN